VQYLKNDMKCFKILLPTYGPSIESRIYPHWRDSPYFTIICFDGNKVLGSKHVSLKSDELIINLVKRESVKYVIALSLSTRALELLNKNNVTVLTGNVTTVGDALSKFKKKELFKLRLIKEKLESS